jgi:hypothetical protein
MDSAGSQGDCQLKQSRKGPHTIPKLATTPKHSKQSIVHDNLAAIKQAPPIQLTN